MALTLAILNKFGAPRFFSDRASAEDLNNIKAEKEQNKKGNGKQSKIFLDQVLD